MRMVDIITKKRDGLVLTTDEIKFFVNGYVKGDIPDYQASAFAMAVLQKGMNRDETSTLTFAMMNSGEIVDLSSIPGFKCDKHSTGGVGDKTTLVLAPLVASCGVKIAKMSGRGLGHTGGTLDKLESIPGYNISLTSEELVKQVSKIGIAVVGQTNDLVPADKKLYSLRDVTGTVDSIPLIASSVMSKKLASGNDAILLDVKYGKGAFMKTVSDAKKLAKTMVNIGRSLCKDTRAIIGDMDQPLGFAIGNSLEVIEAINTLNGEGPEDFKELCFYAGEIMLDQAHIGKDKRERMEMLHASISSGRALAKFRELVAAQGGDVSYIDDPSKFEKAKYSLDILSSDSGYIKSIDPLILGETAMKLGAGREKIDDKIDPSAGIIVHQKVGNGVEPGDLLCTLYSNRENIADFKDEAEKAFRLRTLRVFKKKVVNNYIK